MRWKPIPDPFDVAPRIDINDSPIQRAVQRLIPKAARLEKVLIATPASLPPQVIGATANQSCVACGERVWLSPSSLADIADSNIVCTACIERSLARAAST